MEKRPISVRSTLAYAFAVLVLLVLVVSGLALSELSAANDRFSSYVNGVARRAQLAARIRSSVDERAILARDLTLAQNPDDVPKEHAQVLKAHEDVQRTLSQLESMVADVHDDGGRARALVERIASVERDYGPVALDIVDDAVNNRREQATTKINQRCRPLLAALIAATDAYGEYTRVRGEQLVAQAGENYARQRLQLIAIVIFTVAVAALAGVIITRKVLRTLGAEPFELSEITKRIADGDLSRIARADAAPPGSVLASMSSMQQSLVKLLSQARRSADSITSGTREIAAGNIDLSSRTEQQAAALQETASSMEELTATVSRNAESASRASHLASEASGIAERGSQAVGLLVDTMSEISASSSKVADITSIIEGIAFQTNILALNAAVEAARAGDQGRGFAVVASEVRQLAQRSSSAAKEIKELIGASVGKIQDGAAVADQAGETMTEVTQAVARVNSITEEIAAASAEQSRGIEQVNLAITQMDEVTQQNAALVEQVAAASKALDDQGRMLADSVAVFRLGSEA
ncbi:methyl-accepting chemotaxis protein [Trinickia dabaoshanensis]|uniref:Methyl-accepting chemotaxis protein n=1 Tax=Trinickia dabaoshanensis TaxID=564714 RepID=A0A2N7VAX0_9BURK|nr:methyl-accepting chemotaxis protein [Trinickia dabaoshanensis]PMS13965.1 methyl-accepting chemotaxis protein [Trinickia dabaoshanensis]